jgi:LuxR family quorum-sensing transcriptional regulator LasR
MTNMNELIGFSKYKDAEGWSDRVFKIAEGFGLPYVLFGVKPSKGSAYESAFVQTNIAAKWLDEYCESGFKDVDPALLHCLNHAVPLEWNASTFKTLKQRAFYEEACTYGLCSGITYPIHGPNGQFGLLSFASDVRAGPPALSDVRIRGVLAQLRDYACEFYLNQACDGEQHKTAIRLTPREMECLEWVTAGKTSWEAARILACSEATINFHVSNIIKKLGVQTRQQAVVKGIYEGLVVHR